MPPFRNSSPVCSICLLYTSITSYNVPTATLQVLLKPWDQIAGKPVVVMDPGDSQCFELAVIHLTPTAQLPRACGGTAP